MFRFFLSCHKYALYLISIQYKDFISKIHIMGIIYSVLWYSLSSILFAFISPITYCFNFMRLLFGTLNIRPTQVLFIHTVNRAYAICRALGIRTRYCLCSQKRTEISLMGKYSISVLYVVIKTWSECHRCTKKREITSGTWCGFYG